MGNYCQPVNVIMIRVTLKKTETCHILRNLRSFHLRHKVKFELSFLESHLSQDAFGIVQTVPFPLGKGTGAASLSVCALRAHFAFRRITPRSLDARCSVRPFPPGASNLGQF